MNEEINIIEEMGMLYHHLKEMEEWVSKIQTRVDTINERTKSHTLDIKKLEKKIKEINNETQF